MAIDEVAFLVKVVVEVGMDRGKLLQRLHTPEPQHRSLSSPERQVTVLDPVVGPAADLLLFAIAELVHRGTVGAQAVGAAVDLHVVRRIEERRVDCIPFTNHSAQELAVTPFAGAGGHRHRRDHLVIGVGTAGQDRAGLADRAPVR